MYETMLIYTHNERCQMDRWILYEYVAVRLMNMLTEIIIYTELVQYRQTIIVKPTLITSQAIYD